MIVQAQLCWGKWLIDFVSGFKFQVMATINKFEDLEIWKEARRLSQLIFELKEDELEKLKIEYENLSGTN